jgi:hypothetical protein
VVLTADKVAETMSLMATRLRERAKEVESARDAYEGRLPLKFASDDFRQYFASRYEHFSDNWVGVVADSPTERLDPIAIQLPGAQKGDEDLWRVWMENDSDAEVGLAFLDAIIGRRSYGMVWGNDQDESTPIQTWESPTEVIIGYEPGSRTRRRAGLKLWRDEDDGVEYALFFTREEVWRFKRKAQRAVSAQLYVPPAALSALGQWELISQEENALGEVPFVEFPNRPLLAREPISDVTGVLAMQHAINLLWSQLFTAADYVAWPQRVVMGTERPTVPIFDDNGKLIGKRPIPVEKFAVDKLLWLENPDSRIGEWKAGALDVFTGVIEIAVGHVAAQTRTPQHYLVGKMSNLSADALKAAETGLVKKVEEKQLYFGRSIREMNRLTALAQGDKKKAKAVASSTVRWKDAESRSEAQLVDALLKLKTIGFPFEFLAERYGVEPLDLERIMQMRQRDAAAALEALTADPASMAGPKPEELPAADGDL